MENLVGIAILFTILNLAIVFWEFYHLKNIWHQTHIFLAEKIEPREREFDHQKSQFYY